MANMKLVTAIAHACSDLKQADQDGYLVNQSMAGFIFCKALMQKLPNLQVTYDGRTCRDDEARPNLFIWQDGTTPVVHFVGNLRYGPHDEPDGGDHIRSLENCAAKPAINVLTHDPVSLEYNERQMAISSDLKLGFFTMDEWGINFQYWPPHWEH